MGSPTPDDAPDRPRSSFASGAFLCTVAGFPPPDSRPSLHSACHVVHHGLRARKECAAHRRTAVRPHRRCRTRQLARAAPRPGIALTAAPPARRPMGIMEGVEAAPARRPLARRRRRRAGRPAAAAAAAAARRPLRARLALPFARPRRFAGAMPNRNATLPKSKKALEATFGGKQSGGVVVDGAGAAREDPRVSMVAGSCAHPGGHVRRRGRGRAPAEAGFFAARRRRGGDGDVHERELHGRRPHALDLLLARGAAPKDAAQIQHLNEQELSKAMWTTKYDLIREYCRCSCGDGWMKVELEDDEKKSAEGRREQIEAKQRAAAAKQAALVEQQRAAQAKLREQQKATKARRERPADGADRRTDDGGGDYVYKRPTTPPTIAAAFGATSGDAEASPSPLGRPSLTPRRRRRTSRRSGAGRRRGRSRRGRSRRAPRRRQRPRRPRRWQRRPRRRRRRRRRRRGA